MPAWSAAYPLLVLGLAAGAVYALSGTGLVVLYRTTGIVNFAFGAIGMAGAFVTSSFLDTSWPRWCAFAIGSASAVALSVAYGMLLTPAFAHRDSVSKSVGTLGYALLLVGITFVAWDTAVVRQLDLGVEDWKLDIGRARLNGLHVIVIVAACVVVAATGALLTRTRTGTAMRAVANDRDAAALAGVPLRRIDLIAWVVAGLLGSFVGIVNAALVSFDVNTLAFVLLIPSLAAATIGGLRSMTATLVGGFAIGAISRGATAFTGRLQFVADYSNVVPFLFAMAVMLWFGRQRTIVLAGREMR